MRATLALNVLSSCILSFIFFPPHCMKNVRIRNFFCSTFSRIRTEHGFSLYSVRMGENTDQTKLRVWTLFTQCQFFFLTHFRSSHLQIFLKKFQKNLWSLVPSPLKRDPWAGVPLTILWFFAEHLFKEYFLLRWYLSNETLSIFWKTHIWKNRIFKN